MKSDLINSSKKYQLGMYGIGRTGIQTLHALTRIAPFNFIADFLHNLDVSNEIILTLSGS